MTAEVLVAYLVDWLDNEMDVKLVDVTVVTLVLVVYWELMLVVV